MSYEKNNAIMAIAYDFDGTLARGNIQENSFIPITLGIKKEDFWKQVKELSEENNMDEILSYMYLIVKKQMRLVHKLQERSLVNMVKLLNILTVWKSFLKGLMIMLHKRGY